VIWSGLPVHGNTMQYQVRLWNKRSVYLCMQVVSLVGSIPRQRTQGPSPWWRLSIAPRVIMTCVSSWVPGVRVAAVVSQHGKLKSIFRIAESLPCQHQQRWQCCAPRCPWHSLAVSTPPYPFASCPQQPAPCPDQQSGGQKSRDRLEWMPSERSQWLHCQSGQHFGVGTLGLAIVARFLSWQTCSAVRIQSKLIQRVLCSTKLVSQ
jgi:hypothetical protein